MEIRNYFRTIKKFIWWFITPLIVVVVLTLIFSLIFSESYQIPLSFSVNRRAQDTETSDYQFDSYYAIQANVILASQFAEWLRSGSIISSIYNNAGLDEESSFLAKEWKVTAYSPQNIELLFRGRDKERLAKLAETAIKTTDERKEEFTGTGEAVVGTVDLPDEIITTTKKTPILLNLLVGLLAGVIIGLLFVYFKSIFSSKNN